MKKQLSIICIAVSIWGPTVCAQDSIYSYCLWLAQSAKVVAMNRDVGIDEYALIEYYLQQSDPYYEQKIILRLVENIYGHSRARGAQQIFDATHDHCLADLLVSSGNN